MGVGRVELGSHYVELIYVAQASLNWRWSSHLSFLRDETTGVHHHTQLKKYFKRSLVFPLS